MRTHIGSRRSFICRVKLGQQPHLIDNNNPSSAAYWSSASRANRSRNTLQTMNGGIDDPLNQYSVVHITGYTKVWPPSPNNNSSSNNSNNMMLDPAQQLYQHQMDQDASSSMMGGNNFHLIAIARIQITSAPVDLVNSSNAEFVTRHDQNGMITFVDQRITALLGYKPADMLKKNLYDFCIPQDQEMIKEQLKLSESLKSKFNNFSE